LRERHGIDVMVPAAADRTIVHDIIFEELCRGIICGASRQSYIDIIARGRAAGADSVILGCTEIGLLIGPELIDQELIDLPTFDSTLLHADAAVEFALGRDDAPWLRAA
jgi:aspartate racemase